MKLNSEISGLKTGIINITNVESTIKSIMSTNKKENFCQVVPKDCIVSFMQVFFALEQASYAINSGKNFSKNLQLEFLIRLFGTKQISQALKIAGLKNGMNRVILVCKAGSKKELAELFKTIEKKIYFREKNFPVGKNKKELLALYAISEKTLESLKDLKNPLEGAVIEKNALIEFQT